MKKLITLFLSFFLVATNCYAEYKTLTCIDPKDNYTQIISFDEKVKKSKLLGEFCLV